MTGFQIKMAAPSALQEGSRSLLPEDASYALQTFTHRPLPLVVDDDDRVIAGHVLWEEAKRLSAPYVPTLRLSEIRRVANEECWPFSIEQKRQLHVKASLRSLEHLVAPLEWVHLPESIESAAETLDEIGFFLPLIVDGNGWVIEGDIYLLAARRLGLAQAPVVCLDRLTPFECQRFAEIKVRRIRRAATLN